MLDHIIKNIHLLLEDSIGPNQEITKIQTGNLTVPGENFGSLMLSLKIFLRDHKEEKTRILEMVAKKRVPNEWLREIYNESVTFKKETFFYTTLIPIMKECQIRQGSLKLIDCFPHCYGARLSLNSDELVDDDAVILLENLKTAGYQIVDNTVGFDLKAAEAVLRSLALFHALPIAIKLKQPELFKKKILPQLHRNTIYDFVTEESETIDFILKIISTKPECVPFLSKIRMALQLCLNNIQKDSTPSEPFATLIHNDFWVNNILIQKDDESVKTKIIDFQLIDYGSPGNDIVYFLFTSVQPDVVREHFNYLINVYYDKFVETLKEFNCYSTSFSFDALLEEIDISAKTRQFFYIIPCLKSIFETKDKETSVAEFELENAMANEGDSDEYRKRVSNFVVEFINRKWISERD